VIYVHIKKVVRNRDCHLSHTESSQNRLSWTLYYRWIENHHIHFGDLQLIDNGLGTLKYTIQHTKVRSDYFVAVFSPPVYLQSLRDFIIFSHERRRKINHFANGHSSVCYHMKSELIYKYSMTRLPPTNVYGINTFIMYIMYGDKLIFEFIDNAARRVFTWTISEITIVFVEVIKLKGMKCSKPYNIYNTK